MAAYTSDFLVLSIKRRGSIPTSQNFLKLSDFYALINEELQSNLIPLLMSVREEYLVADFDYQVVANQASYRIPQRAIAGKLRDVLYVMNGQTIAYPLARLDESDAVTSNTGYSGFYIQGNSIVLSPTPTGSTDILRLKHFRRPSTVVDISACGQVQSINLATNQVTCVTIPSTFANGIKCDMVKAQSGFECLQIDAPITSLSGTTITFSSLPTDIAVGDWISLAGESPIPQIPQELHPLLAQLVAVKCLEALGDAEGLQAAETKLSQLKTSIMMLLTPRVDGSPKKIKSNNTLISTVRRGSSHGWNR